MPEPRTTPRQMSAGVILVDREGRVLLQLRDSDPAIHYPDHWGITGGAAQPGETPEETARREVAEETGLTLGAIDPFRAYYFAEETKGRSRRRIERELFLFHAPCEQAAEEMICGEGRALRFFGPADIAGIDLAYNHRDVLADFFSSGTYAAYLRGDAFTMGDPVDVLGEFIEALDGGVPWFDAMMDAIARWQRPRDDADGRSYSFLVGGEAFDWLLLAERLIEAAGDRVPAAQAERLLFEGTPPDSERRGMDDSRLRALIGDAKHRAHLNFIYGVTVEEALLYAIELDVAKERANVTMRNGLHDEVERDPVYERVYGRGRTDLWKEFRLERRIPSARAIPMPLYREFLYWLFKYRVKHTEPARVASDTRKALALLSSMDAAVRRLREPEREPVAAGD